MNLVKRESASNGDCHWAWKLKPDRVADAGVHFLRDRIHGEHSGGEGRGRATVAVGSRMEDEEQAAAAAEETRRKARRTREGVGDI